MLTILNSAVRYAHSHHIAVVCQNDRSEHRYRVLLGAASRRLYERELKKREQKAAAEEDAKTDIGWGHQIRSFVLKPYHRVKRSGLRRFNPDHLGAARRRYRSVHSGGTGAKGVRHRTEHVDDVSRRIGRFSSINGGGGMGFSSQTLQSASRWLTI